MVDVRSLLRSELASRGSSTQSGSAGTRVTKKRKIEGTDHPIPSIHKKSRPTTPAHAQTPEEDDIKEATLIESNQGAEDVAEEENPGVNIPDIEIDRQDANSPNEQKTSMRVGPSQIPEPDQTINEDEWAAFQRDVVAPTRIPQAPAITAAPATISAAPITADELAVQQQKQKEEQARAREEYVEGEKEDAARLLEEEFEEMEQLEERVKRLKAKREELRAQNLTDSNGTTLEDAQEPTQLDGDESEEVDDDADWDDWRFR
ncbi:hypothetical protein UA08_08974 [Talaromyces atroroseus]|uniref:Uncharacterized protein n=1 Tax=Talaromyces atroroseus TaxID=1441469 RepID=A0A1Q5Q7C5_TALAT|nr:hypothetical protein UA08_08974 [Talaromyces atroroseus]OKL55745.1 hypothetical protein UA08_08974 [Talaromyces atroroseus]